jgi:hypothetical protein
MRGQAWDAGGESRIIAPGSGAIRAVMILLAAFTSLFALITVFFVATGAVAEFLLK